MNIRRWSAAILGLAVVSPAESWGQLPTSAKVETAPLELKAPDRYQINAVLEPIRRVTVTVPFDGILRSLEQPVGATVRERQELAQLDRTEAAAKLKIAQANVKEAKATLAASPSSATAQAQLEAAQARQELAELDHDRCTLRAPFAGLLLDVPVSSGQYLPKGARVADLADVSSLRVLVPVERGSVAVGASLSVRVEGQSVAGKVHAVLPLPETFATLRELSSPFSAAWVIVSNPKGEMEPGQRVLGPSLPTTPLATIPSRALKDAEKGEAGGGPKVQVIRNEYVTDIPVKVLGRPGPERVQVSGLFRPNDALIVSTSVTLMAGTLIRFNGSSSDAIEGTSPNPAEGGEVAGITPPRTGARGTGAASTAKPRTTTRPSTKPAVPPAGSSPPAAPPPF